MFYDQFNRLDYSLQYLYYPYENASYLFRRFSQNYGTNPVHYPSSLDLANYRFYKMTGAWNGAFEESVPIFDKNYAAQSISFEQWDDWGESWYPVTSSFYGVLANNSQIALINGQPNNYTGYFYFDEHGSYIGRDIVYTNNTVDEYQVNWTYSVPNNDPTETPAVQMISAYPNPFNSDLNIKLDCKTLINSDISIYNIKGQLIKSWKGVKSNELTWDGRDKDNKPVKSGVYLIKAGQGQDTSVVKVIKY